MGWGKYVLGGIARALGIVIVVLALVLLLYALVVGQVWMDVGAVVLIIVGGLFWSWGSYTRRQNTPMGRYQVVPGK